MDILTANAVFSLLRGLRTFFVPILFFVLFSYSLYRKDASFEWTEPVRLATARGILRGTEAEVRLASERHSRENLFSMESLIPRKPIKYRKYLSGENTSFKETKILRKNESIEYVITVNSGVLINATLVNEGALMTIIGQHQEPLDNLAVDTVSWQGHAPYTGKYFIRVKPNGIGDENENSLMIELRPFERRERSNSFG